MSSAATDPDELCHEVARRYREFATYRDEGVVSSRAIPSPEASMPRWTHRKHFRTLFVRPDSFRFEFRDEPIWGKQPESEWHLYVMWSLAGVTNAWWTLRPRVRRAPNLFDELGTSAGISGGSSTRIACLLLPDHALRSVLPAPGTGTIVDVEPIGAFVCHRLEFQSRPTSRTTLWIDVESFLVRRVLEATRFTKEFQATLHRQSQEVLANRPLDEDWTPERKRFIEEHPPSVRGEWVNESTTNYKPEIDQPIQIAEFESRLPG